MNCPAHIALLHNGHIPAFFATLDRQFRLLAPVLLADGTRNLGTLADGTLALIGGRMAAKPTAAFFPQIEAILPLDGVREERRQLLVAGFTARDLACLAFIDRFFAAAPADDIYCRNRREALVIGVSGYCGASGELLPPADGGCDLELVFDGTDWLALGHSEAGAGLCGSLPDAGGNCREQLEAMHREGEKIRTERVELIHRAAAIVQSDMVPDDFWSEIADRCIACTGCNLVCPTCTCFGVQDWRYAAGVERSRMWDSCQLEGFMREASGHNPLKSERERTRRRIHHKLAADAQRWGEISCFDCGRCDAACPTGIGIVSVMKELVARFD